MTITPNVKIARGACLLVLLSATLLSACDVGDVLGRKARGNWQGHASQVNADGSISEYPITIIIIDDEHIAIDYPTLECDTTLTRLPSSDGHAEFREDLQTDNAACLDGGLVTMVLSETDNSKLSWRWKFRPDANELIYATSVLNRVPPAEPKTLQFFRDQAKNGN